MKAHAEQTFKFDLTDLNEDEAKVLEMALIMIASLDQEGDIDVDEIGFEYNSAFHKTAKKMAADVKAALKESSWRE
jgi:hypothetical protein